MATLVASATGLRTRDGWTDCSWEFGSGRSPPREHRAATQDYRENRKPSAVAMRSSLKVCALLALRSAHSFHFGGPAFAAARTMRSAQRLVFDAVKFDPEKYITKERSDETCKYVMQQTMLRVKDPAESLDFYCNVLG